MQIGRTERFKKAWKRLPETDKKSARKAIFNLAVNINYPSLRVKKVQGTSTIWEARVSLRTRITFEMSSDKIILRNIGQHDEVLKQP
jgi:mRNA-degrading endonuclease RelE of RelBE toxin-antitoxin system